MKKAVSVLLILLSLLIGFQRLIIVLHYQFNWERIEQQFCENKDSIIITCKGVCYIQKAFQKTEDKTTKSSKVVYQIAEVFFEPFLSLYNLKLESTLTLEDPSYIDVIYANPLIEVIVPPPLSSLLYM